MTEEIEKISEVWPLSRLKNWEKNPRAVKGKRFEDLKQQIKQLKIYKPLLVAQDGTVLGGNMRLRALRDLGYKDVWVSVVDAPTDELKLKYALSDNDSVGYYVEEQVAELAFELPEVDFGSYYINTGEGISLSEVKDRLQPTEEDDFSVEDNLPEEGEAVTNPGNYWALGSHRLLCGDSTNEEEVKKLMQGQKADMIFTDPPYGVSYADKNAALNAIGRGNSIQRPIENDHKSVDEMYNIWIKAFKNIVLASKDGFSYYVCSPQGGELMMTMMALKDVGIQVKHTIIWVKNQFVIGRSDYHYQHEPILYGWGKGSHTFYGGRDQTSVWDFRKPIKSDLHPTMKPIELCAKAINNSSKGGDLVLDIFGGSGSTLIACEQLGRTCYMMELDPRYCDVIIKRWEEFTGEKAQLIKEQ